MRVSVVQVPRGADILERIDELRSLAERIEEGNAIPPGAEGQVVGYGPDGEPMALNLPDGTLPPGAEGQIVGYGPGGIPRALTPPEAPPPYDDTALTARVTELEERPEPTPYDDTAIVGRVAALESRPDPEPYDDTALTGRVTALEQQEVIPAGSEGQVVGYGPGGEPVAISLPEGTIPPGAPGQVVGYGTDGQPAALNLPDGTMPPGSAGQVVGYGPDGTPAAVDLPVPYDDAALAGRVAALEARPEPEPYDDTALTGRVETIEQAIAVIPPAYDDTALSGRVTVLEQSFATRYHAATDDALASVTTDAQQTIIVDTATLTQDRDLRITAQAAGVPGGMIRIYSLRTDDYNRRVRIGTAAAFTTIPAQRYVELWWDGAAWIVLRNVAIDGSGTTPPDPDTDINPLPYTLPEGYKNLNEVNVDRALTGDFGSSTLNVFLPTWGVGRHSIGDPTKITWHSNGVATLYATAGPASTNPGTEGRNWYTGAMQWNRPKVGLGRFGAVVHATNDFGVAALFAYHADMEVDFERTNVGGVIGWAPTVHSRNGAGVLASSTGRVMTRAPWTDLPQHLEAEIFPDRVEFYHDGVLFETIVPADIPGYGATEWHTVPQMNVILSCEKHGTWAGWGELAEYTAAKYIRMHVHGILVEPYVAPPPTEVTYREPGDFTDEELRVNTNPTGPETLTVPDLVEWHPDGTATLHAEVRPDQPGYGGRTYYCGSLVTRSSMHFIKGRIGAIVEFHGRSVAAVFAYADSGREIDFELTHLLDEAGYSPNLWMPKATSGRYSAGVTSSRIFRRAPLHDGPQKLEADLRDDRCDFYYQNLNGDLTPAGPMVLFETITPADFPADVNWDTTSNDLAIFTVIERHGTWAGWFAEDYEQPASMRVYGITPTAALVAESDGPLPPPDDFAIANALDPAPRTIAGGNWTFTPAGNARSGVMADGKTVGLFRSGEGAGGAPNASVAFPVDVGEEYDAIVSTRGQVSIDGFNRGWNGYGSGTHRYRFTPAASPHNVRFTSNFDGVMRYVTIKLVKVSGGTPQAPQRLTNPAISPASGQVGTVFTVTPGTYSGADSINPGTLMLDSTDVTSQMAGNAWTSTAAGALQLTGETATNAAGTTSPASSNTATVTAAPVGANTSSLSTNLSSVSDWGTNWPFLNMIKFGRGFQTGWGGSENHAALRAAGHLDADGYPVRIPPGASNGVEFIFDFKHVPASQLTGRYVFRYDGEGDFALYGAGNSVVSQVPGQIVFDLANGSSAFSIKMWSINEADYPRNWRMCRENEVALLDAGETFRPEWKALVEKNYITRFMDWGNTNHNIGGANPSATYAPWFGNWALRPKPSDVSYALTHVPLEIIVQLANETGTNPWINIPHIADETFIRNTAAYIVANLDPSLDLRQEWSNEHWGGHFAVMHWCATQAAANWNGSTRWYDWAAKKATEAAIIFNEEWAKVGGPKPGLVHVLGTQSPWITEQLLTAPDWQSNEPSEYVAPRTIFHETGITTYFGGGVITDTTTRAALMAQIDANPVAARAWLRDYLLNPANGSSIPALATGYQEHRDLLDDVFADTGRRLRLVAYEGGTHVHHSYFTGLTQQEIDEQTAWLSAFSYSSEMGELYTALGNLWEQYGQGPHMEFAEVASPQPSGSWAARRFLGDTNPRQAVVDSWATRPQWWL